MKILAVGDVVGASGVQYLKEHLRDVIVKHGVDLTVVNGENSADVRGISAAGAQEIFAAGADVITTGNHAFGQRDVYTMLDDEKYLLRPDNFPGTAPGHGSVIINAAGARVLCINLQGLALMRDAVMPPFAAADAVLRREAGKYDIALLDFHAEATSEKVAMGRYLDGRVSAVWGTHTHVPTADCAVLPHGSGYVTDLGMCGPRDGVLGVAYEPIIAQFLTSMPQRYTVAQGSVSADAVLFDIATDGKCRSVTRLTF